MGIKGLTKFLRQICPEVFIETSMNCYAYDKIAVDASIYVYELKTIAKDKFPEAMLNFIINLRAKKIHPIFIFDGIAPPEKADERKKRAEVREKQILKVKRLEEAIKIYENTKELNEELRLIGMLARGQFSIETAKKYVNEKIIDVGEVEFQTLKTLLTLTKTPQIQAEGEAEVLCAQLVKQGIVKAALTKDTDILTLGCPMVFNKINYKDGTFTAICLESILTALNLTYSQFVDFCIMCGTDYNKNIYKIGPYKSYDLIKKYGSIEALPENLDTSILNHKRVREIFALEEKSPLLTFAASPNYTKLYEWMINNNVSISVKDIRQRLENNPKKK